MNTYGDASGAPSGELVLVGTPIGNLDDASARLGAVLSEADVIAAEDTRRLRALCARLSVSPTGQVISYFDGNEAQRAPQLVQQMVDGAKLALVTDAGMPGVSDPGYRLVRAAIDAGVPITVVPGPSAALTALVLSGLPVRRFCFEGFAPRKPGERARHLAELAGETRTMVFFEAPHRLAGFLAAAAEAFGHDRPGAICRELTKPYEQVVRATLSELAQWAADGVRGEIAVVIAGRAAPSGGTPLAVALEDVAALVAAGTPTSAAVASVAEATGLRRKALYDAVLASRVASREDDPMEGAPAGPERTDASSPRGPVAAGDHSVDTPVDVGVMLGGLQLPDMPARLPAPVIDSHTHLDAVLDKAGLSPEDNLAAAAAVGVGQVVQIGCDVESSAWATSFAATHPQVVAAVAIHPNDAARLSQTQLRQQLSQIEALAGAGPHVRAVGETGLDYYRTRDEAGRARQRQSFSRHIDIAAALGLTLAIHDRDAHDDVLAVLDEAALRPPRVIMHCFSGDAAFAQQCVDRGYWLSFPGTVTFRDADDLRRALRLTPIDQLLVETDAPYLTPAPARGRPNASYLMAHTVRFLAEQRGDDLASLCRALRANAEAAYGGPWGQPGVS